MSGRTFKAFKAYMTVEEALAATRETLEECCRGMTAGEYKQVLEGIKEYAVALIANHDGEKQNARTTNVWVQQNKTSEKV